MKVVCKFEKDLFYGTLYGLFVEDIELINALVESKIEVYCGEIMGHNSEVWFDVSHDDMTIINNDDVVDFVTRHNLTIGFNPFDNMIGGGEAPLPDIIADSIEKYNEDNKVRQAMELYVERKRNK